MQSSQVQRFQQTLQLQGLGMQLMLQVGMLETPQCHQQAVLLAVHH